MTIYNEVEDLKEIQRLQKQLYRQIERDAPHVRKRSIGYPSGQFEANVHFTRDSGPARWWLTRLADSEESWINFIGRGDPDEGQLLLIDLQFNMVATHFHRRLGGAFVRDADTGRVYLAHRGIVTRGKSRIPRDRLFASTTEQLIAVQSSSGSRPMLLAAALDSDFLLDDLARFAEEIRAALDRAPGQSPSGSLETNSSKTKTRRDPFAIALHDFEEEFSGSRTMTAREQGIAVVRHGLVVRALNQVLEQVGATKNAQKVDLFVLPDSRDAYLFEVKTAINTTNLYTGIGQLYLHAAALAPNQMGKAIRKVLVIPGEPSPDFRKRVRDQIGIDVLAFEWKSDGGVRFEPLTSIGLGGKLLPLAIDALSTTRT